MEWVFVTAIVAILFIADKVKVEVVITHKHIQNTPELKEPEESEEPEEPEEPEEANELKMDTLLSTITRLWEGTDI